MNSPAHALARLARPSREIGADSAPTWIGELVELELDSGELLEVRPVALGIVGGRLETAPDRRALTAGLVYATRPDDREVAVAALRYLRDPAEPPERPAGSAYWRHETPRTVCALGADGITSIVRAPRARICPWPSGAYLCGG